MTSPKFHCDEEKLLHNGLSARAFVYNDYAIEMHSHDFYEVNIILSGTGTHCIENGRAQVLEGDVFVIPPAVEHGYIDTDELDVYHILLKKSFLEQGQSWQIKGFLQLTEIEPLLRGNFSQYEYLHLTRLQMEQLNAELTFIDDGGEYDWDSCAPLKYHTIWKIIYWFSLLLDRQLHDRNQENPYKLQILQAMSYLHQHYEEKITIETLCNQVFLSRSTFLRNFKAVCGEAPMTYLNKYRCKKAMEMLEGKRHSKTEVAHSCGFYDLSHMERALRGCGQDNIK